MDWYTTAIADGTTLDVLLARIAVEVKVAVDSGAMPAQASLYAVRAGQYMRLHFNAPAVAAIPAIANLAFRPSLPPHERDMVQTLISR